MTEPCVEAFWLKTVEVVPLVTDNADYICLSITPKEERTQRLKISRGGAEVLAAELLAAMHSSRPVEDGRVLAETAYAQEGPAREGETHGHHVLRIAEKAASLALTTQASELSALKGEIERKDAAIRRYISVHGVLTDDDREYLRQALTPEKGNENA